MSNDPESLQERVDELEREVTVLRRGQRQQTIRRRSEATFLGLPVWEIACGPDPENNEVRGHARAVIAVGDIATGWLAIGGFARGIIAFGGCAIGGISIGGLSIGMLAALGGCAIGTIALGGAAIGLLAFGGGAIGYVAVGGGAFGHYACGGGALGEHVISAAQRDPEAVKFFTQWFPWVLGRFGA